LSFDIPPVRFGLYIALTVFSAVLFGLTAARLRYTTHLPTGDPLNNGRSFYDPVIAELLFTTFITMIWCIFGIIAIFRRLEFRFFTTFLGEILVLTIIWLFWIIGAAVATSIWGDLSWCQHFYQCRLLTAIVAFSWLGWITLTALLVITVLFSIANNALQQPLHGRWDPRISTYSSRRTSRV